jgi:hypothetical protein
VKKQLAGTGDGLDLKSLDPTQRAGILTQSGFLTLTGASDGSNPVKRGRKVYERFLCQTLPPPPNNVPPPKPPTPGLTTRQRFMEHDQMACAQGCHNVMDPIGFGFEHYDGLGAWRTLDQNLPVDSSGSIEIDGMKKPFADAIELTKLLSTSAQVRGCMVMQMLEFALLREGSTDDQASLNNAYTAFSNGSFSLKELLVGLAKTRTFRYRSLAAGEVQP